jgi:Flp pilus assembly CpaF family ATPase
MRKVVEMKARRENMGEREISPDQILRSELRMAPSLK